MNLKVGVFQAIIVSVPIQPPIEDIVCLSGGEKKREKANKNICVVKDIFACFCNVRFAMQRAKSYFSLGSASFNSL